MKRFFIFLIVICFSANVFAQITKQQAADLVLNTIVGNKIDTANISGYGLYYVSNCNITKSVNDTGYFRNGIQIYYCGNSNSAIKSIYNNTINYCNGTGLMVYNSIGDIVINKIHDNDNGVKLLNNSTINKFMGNSNASRPLNTQLYS